jgi:hypothetical protein
MNLGRYAQACNEFESELLEYLTKKDVSELREDCAALGRQPFLDWMTSQLKIIHSFVAATPSQRQKRKYWDDPVLRRRLVLAGIWYLRCAYRLLDGIDQYHLAPGGSYRETAARAGKAYTEIYYKLSRLWPFGGQDPFEYD